MIRTTITGTALVLGLLTPSAFAAGPAPSTQSAAQATAADAAPFMGNWTLALEGPNGPATFDLMVKLDKDKVVGEITTPTTGSQSIADVTKAERSLLLRYSFNYEGNPVDAVIRLTPAPESKVNAEIDFAGGAYVMTGSATKKDKDKTH